MRREKYFSGIITAAVLFSTPMLSLITAMPAAAEDTQMSAKELAEGFTIAYTGQYSDTLDILLGFDNTDGLALVTMYDSENGMPEWICMGTYTIDDDDICLIENPEVDTSFSFQLISETDDTLEILLEEGSLTLETAPEDAIEDFLTAMLAGEFGSSDTSDTFGGSSSGASSELAEGFDLAYYGKYSDTLQLLLAFDTTNAMGLAAILESDDDSLNWVCMGDWLGEDGDYQFNDTTLGNVFEFSVEDQTEDTITINLPDGSLTLNEADLSMVSDFFTKMEEGGFAQ